MVNLGGQRDKFTVKYSLINRGIFRPRSDHVPLGGSVYLARDPTGLALAEELGAVEILERREI